MDEKRSVRTNVFHNRNFALVFIGALVSELGAMIFTFAISFYILRISNNNAFLQGLYLSVCSIAALLSMPVGGVMGDRYDKVKIMYISDFIIGFSILIAAGLLLLTEEKNHILILFVLGILRNIVGGIFSPASSALIPVIVNDDQLMQANSYLAIKSSFTGIAGIILAGILYGALSVPVLFIVTALTYIASAISETMVKVSLSVSEEKMSLQLFFKDMKDGLDYLKAQRALLALLTAIIFINFFAAPISSNFMPYFVSTDLTSTSSYLFDHVLTPEMWSSVLNGCAGIGSLIGAVLLSNSKTIEKCGKAVSERLFVESLLILLLSSVYYICVDRQHSINIFLIIMSLGLLLNGILLTYINIPLNTLTMRIVDKESLSKVTSIISVGSQAMVPIASVLAGTLLDQFGSSILLFFCSFGLVAVALSLLFNKQVKEL